MRSHPLRLDVMKMRPSFFPRPTASAGLFAMLLGIILPFLPFHMPCAAESEEMLKTFQVEERVFLGVLPKHVRSADGLQSFSLVIDLRYPYEGVYDEMGALRSQGITHINLPTSSHGPDQDTINKLKQLLLEHSEERVLIHDSTGYRTAILWAAYRVDAGVDPAVALKEVSGMTNDPGVAQAIQQYGERQNTLP